MEIKNPNWFAPVFIIIWSTGFIIAKYGMPYSEPMTFLALRFTGVLLILVPFILWFKAPWPTWKQARHLAVAGALIQFFYLGGVWMSVRQGMPAGLSALIVGLQPILTAVFASFLAEKVSRTQWVGLMLGLLGVFLVVYAKIDTAGVSVMNLLFNAVALIAITGGTMYQKKFCPQFDLRTGSTIQFATSALLATIGAFLFETRQIDWTVSMIGALVWGIVCISIGAMTLLFLLIQKGNATKVSSLMYLTPPTTALMAWVLFDEKLSILIIIGTFITMLGVLIVNQNISLQNLKRILFRV
ncbi:DMT family transporter [Polynucleobacter kasalickyi]|uniref:Permease of the drug/metabolite transporter (DMT) superfamily n=1 Tax=Polynucleobacter kasalickyi TaxID=1938817 RepID=A0A1W2B1Y1_9BURK|nr:DMT family transporter [Polynucleobacter kasalickyi]SMC66926.1 Permease of the drug/metabolite transporter (DMT) superfamily [Polynucleobacter kasalickyi]